MVLYGMSLPLVTPRRNKSSAFKFRLLTVLVALSLSEPILYFEVSKGVKKGENWYLHLNDLNNL